MQGLYFPINRILSKNFENTLSKLQNAGFNAIVFDVKDMQGDLYIKINEEHSLKYTVLTPLYNLDDFVNLLHSYGFYAIARVVQFYNINTATKHPFLCPQKKDNGAWQEKADLRAWLDSSHPTVQEENLEILRLVCQSEVDEIQLDYIRFPTEGKISSAVFFFEEEDNQRKLNDPNYINRDKTDIIYDYLVQVKKITKNFDKKLTADVFAILAWDRNIDKKYIGQNIYRISSLLESIHPMVYSSHFTSDFQFSPPDFTNKPYHIVKYAISRLTDISNENCSVIPYLQAFSWNVQYCKEYVFDQINASKITNSPGYLLWNSSGNYGNTIEWISEWNNNLNQGKLLLGWEKGLNLPE
jgi:hypothetical protein